MFGQDRERRDNNIRCEVTIGKRDLERLSSKIYRFNIIIRIENR